MGCRDDGSRTWASLFASPGCDLCHHTFMHAYIQLAGLRCCGSPPKRRSAQNRRAPLAGGTSDGVRATMPPKTPDPSSTRCAGAAPDPELAARATWWRYVVTVTGNAAQKDKASTTGVDQSSISRWQGGIITPRAEAVVALARAYGRLRSRRLWQRATCPAPRWEW
jgi:hypothetical protein